MGLANIENIKLLEVPVEFDDVYSTLVKKIRTYGVDLLKDCAAHKQTPNVNLVNCWHMFEAACFAYKDNALKESFLLVNYIIAQLCLNIAKKVESNKDDVKPLTIIVDKIIGISSGVIDEYDNTFVNIQCESIEDLEIIVDVDWVTFTKVQDEEENWKIQITAKENELSTTRKGKVTFKYNDESASSIIIQEANPNLEWS